MSSHHIVRENQEPALVVADFETLSRDELGQLLEWSPVIITDRVNLDFFLAEEIKVDIVYGERPQGIAQDNIQFIDIPYEGDFVVQALYYLSDHRFKAVNILASTLPETQGFVEQLNIVVFCQGKRYAFFRSIFEKWKPKGERVYIEESRIKSFQGLDYIGQGEFLTTADGFVWVEFNTADYVLVGEDV